MFAAMTNRREPENRRRSTPRGGQGRPAGKPADPATGATDVLANAVTLIHELANLADGSSRLLGLAMRSLDRAKAESGGQAVDHAHKQLESASFAVSRMADLVRCAMKGASIPIGSSSGDGSKGVSIAEAVEHAVRVVQPEADEHRIEVHADVSPEAGALPSGALYSVLLNGLRNAIDAVLEARRGAGSTCGGRIELSASLDPAPPGHRVRWVVITISDDGVGPPKGIDSQRVFDHGYTTKPKGTGIGLALAASLVREMHGMIQLAPRAVGGLTCGATLRMAIPALAPSGGASSVGPGAGGAP